jgi:SPRY domain-containing SOCS box protein 1/4
MDILEESLGLSESSDDSVIREPEDTDEPAITITASELSNEFAPVRVDMLLAMKPVSEEVQLNYSWNPEDKSANIRFKQQDDTMTLYRNPVAQSTDCIRGKKGFKEGIHVWAIHWSTSQRGTHPAVGVATKDAQLNAVGYETLLGCDDHSWGWNLVENRLFHNITNDPLGRVYPSKLKPDESFVVPDNFQVILDMDEGTLAFMAEGEYLGVAFEGLRGQEIFPAVSVVWGHCEVTMKYIGGLVGFKPIPLQLLCRSVIRKSVTKERLDGIDELQLPTSIKKFLKC